MSTHVTPRPARRSASPAQLEWLGRELSIWQAEGLVHDDQAAAILRRYHATRRFSLARLLLALGAVFVGVGLIWLVAANLDQLPPLLRFLAVASIWLVLLVGGEVLHSRRPLIPFQVIEAVRLLAALAFGAVVFQAAQSLQVPAFEPLLVGLWGIGALVHAYGVRALGPLLVGIPTLVTWFVWQVQWDAPSGFSAVLALAVVAVAAVSAGALHERGLRPFGPVWREVGAGLALAALFAAALPSVTATDFVWSTWLVAGTIVAGLTAGAAIVLVRGYARLEPIGALVVLAASVLMVLWDAGDDPEVLTLVDWAHAAVSVCVYVVVAVGVAVLGILRNSWRLTALATAGLVVFTTVQSFAVFAQIIQGAWLFVILGLIFLGTGYLFDRARRELAATLEGEDR
ncbi:MAG TPA: DUF2157 domain-containing protein [Nocardioides sp.]|nr:DUF2157 domain-containing protein [Nocardioides sp.]